MASTTEPGAILPPTGEPFDIVGTTAARFAITLHGKAGRSRGAKMLLALLAHRDHLAAQVTELQASNTAALERARAAEAELAASRPKPREPVVPEMCSTCHEFPAEFGDICIACDCDEHGETKEAEATRVEMRAKAAREPTPPGSRS